MRTAFWIVHFLLAAQAWAGEVVLKNGDRLSGRIIRMDKSSVDFETDLLGKLAVPWNAIVRIQSDSPLYVAVTDDRVVLGKVSMRDGRLEIEPKNGDTLEYAKDAVRARSRAGLPQRHQVPSICGAARWTPPSARRGEIPYRDRQFRRTRSPCIAP